MSQTLDLDTLIAIAREFDVDAEILDVETYGSGNVNDTFRVRLNGELRSANGPSEYFILQRINRRVFRRPDTIMHNMRTFTQHMRRRLATEGGGTDARGSTWQMPEVISARNGQDWYVDGSGEYWRAITFIDNGRTYDRILNGAHAYEAGHALGRFHSLISDLSPDSLFDTLEGFHITPQYLRQYDETRDGWCGNGSVHNTDIEDAMAFVEARRATAGVLEAARARGDLTVRPIHGDPKINNFVIDDVSGRAISLIDLDTVKPGLIHYDIGDCLRSCCNPSGEETDDLASVTFDMDLCQSILTGYLSAAATFLRDQDYRYIYDAVRLICFELGLRFFSDHLAGDRYFKVHYAGHNLQRARVQFELCRHVEQAEEAIRTLVDELRMANA